MFKFTFVIVLALAACSECKPSKVRCQEGYLEVCSDAKRWEETQDCSEIMDAEGSPWTCCETSDAGEPECLPLAECGG